MGEKRKEKFPEEKSRVASGSRNKLVGRRQKSESSPGTSQLQFRKSVRIRTEPRLPSRVLSRLRSSGSLSLKRGE